MLGTLRCLNQPAVVLLANFAAVGSNTAAQDCRTVGVHASTLSRNINSTSSRTQRATTKRPKTLFACCLDFCYSPYIWVVTLETQMQETNLHLWATETLKHIAPQLNPNRTDSARPWKFYSFPINENLRRCGVQLLRFRLGFYSCLEAQGLMDLRFKICFCNRFEIVLDCFPLSVFCFLRFKSRTLNQPQTLIRRSSHNPMEALSRS